MITVTIDSIVAWADNSLIEIPGLDNMSFLVFNPALKTTAQERQTYIVVAFHNVTIMDTFQILHHKIHGFKYIEDAIKEDYSLRVRHNIVNIAQRIITGWIAKHEIPFPRLDSDIHYSIFFDLKRNPLFTEIREPGLNDKFTRHTNYVPFKKHAPK